MTFHQKMGTWLLPGDVRQLTCNWGGVVVSGAPAPVTPPGVGVGSA